VVSHELPERLRRFVADARWKDTAHVAPHQYIHRNWGDEGLFLDLLHLIRGQGSYQGYKYGRRWTYFDIDEWTYWTMGAPESITIIINRRRKEQM
jgi:hypothetical protein